MRVKVIGVEIKDITTKTGQAMKLRIVQGYTEAMQVFKFTLPRGHADISGPGDYRVVPEPYIDFEAGLSARCRLEALTAAVK